MNDDRRPPSPPGHWLLGNANLLKRDFMELLAEIPREYGDIVRLRFGPYSMALLSHPSAIEQVLITQGKKFDKPPRFRRLLRPAFGNGVIANRGQSWQRQRQRLQTVLETIDPANHCELFVECAQRNLATWSEGSDDNISERITALTLAGRAKTTLGMEQPHALECIHDEIREFLPYFTARLRSPLAWPLWMPTGPNRRMRAALKRWWSLLDGEIERALHSDSSETHLLAGLIRLETDSTMTRRQLRDELATWLLAGTETTANTIAWACYELARHSADQDRLFDEVQTELRGRMPRFGDQTKLKFLHCVLSEAMRLYPQGYVIGRRAREPFVIDGYRFPKKTTVLLNQWFIGRDSRWFDDPSRFNPTRWEGNLQDRLPRFAFFPFGGGGRVCIGRSTAMLEMPMILAMLVQRFRFALSPDTKVRADPSITLQLEWERGTMIISRR